MKNLTIYKRAKANKPDDDTAIKRSINKDGSLFKNVNSKPNKELLKALQEGEDILNGKVKAKSYTNMYNMLNDLKKS